MEHFDIEDAFNRMAPPTLELRWGLIPRVKMGPEWRWLLIVYLANEAHASARFPYLNLTKIEGTKFSTQDMSGHFNFGLKGKFVDDWQCFSGGADDEIHPGQMFPMVAFSVGLSSLGDNEWQFQNRRSISFDYQCGCLNSRMRQGHMIIERADIAKTLQGKRVDIASD